MKKVFIVFAAVLITNVAAFAQVTLQPGIPAVGLIQKNQLWNVLVINSANVNYKCILQINLQDRSTGADLLTATSTQFDIIAGTKQLNANLLGPIQYNYLVGGIDNRLQGLIPVGSYTACYQLVVVAGKPETLAEECVQFDAEPLSPPMLIFPADSSVLENAPQQFSWMPPTPDGIFNSLRYELLITEIKGAQKPEEAIQQNIPFYNDGALFANRMNYPASAIAFEKDKWYAWQVTARDDKAYAGKSEVWVFKIINDVVKKIIENAPYIKISTKQQEVTIVHDGRLKMEYYNYYTDTTVNVTVRRETEKEKAYSFQLQVNPGQNYLEHNIGKKMHLDEDSVYIVELTNKAGERYYMKFKPKNY